MQTKQYDAADTLHFSGALTFDHWREVQSLSKRFQAHVTGYTLLIAASACSCVAMCIAYLQGMDFLAVMTGTATTLVSTYSAWVLVYDWRNRKHRLDAAENSRGWFAPSEWEVTASHIRFSTNTKHGEHSGVIPWSSCQEVTIGHSVLLLRFDYPYNSAVIARDWLKSQTDWDRMLNIANSNADSSPQAA